MKSLNVGELIEKLQQYPKDRKVITVYGDATMGFVKDVEVHDEPIYLQRATEFIGDATDSDRSAEDAENERYDGAVFITPYPGYKENKEIPDSPMFVAYIEAQIKRRLGSVKPMMEYQ